MVSQILHVLQDTNSQIYKMQNLTQDDYKMFCNVVRSEQVQGNLDTFRFCRVLFGIVCSPFLSESTLRIHLRNTGTPVAKKITDNIYADNVTIGAESAEKNL